VLPIPIIFAGWLDGQVMFILIVLAGAFINWLSKRREAQSEKNPPPENGKADTADWEEKLRRLLGEELVPPPVRPPSPQRPPPPIVRVPGTGPAVPPRIKQVAPPASSSRLPGPALRTWGEDGESLTSTMTGGVRDFEPQEAARRELLRTRHARRPAVTVFGGSLRESRTAREAFVASVIFSAPKGLEG
jgi:hypothetical protein